MIEPPTASASIAPQDGDVVEPNQTTTPTVIATTTATTTTAPVTSGTTRTANSPDQEGRANASPDAARVVHVNEPRRPPAPAVIARRGSVSAASADHAAIADGALIERAPLASGAPRPAQQPPQLMRALPPLSTKRRSSWRYLLSPSYKSRSDEFHKLFADELPKGERLVADYSCALHREILLQGRLYVSINYLAFYSNIFSWITKLVVPLRDIRDIHKANTAKIIPNAIQLFTGQGDKHVFASFIARDKSYIMIWRVWRNSGLVKERLTDQEIRRLVHLSYGKDLGMNDSEEQRMLGLAPPPLPQAQLPPVRPNSTGSQSSNNSPDDNNNNNNSDRHAKKKPIRLRFKSRSQSQKEVLSLIHEGESNACPTKLHAKSHKRNNSVDLSKTLSATLPVSAPIPSRPPSPPPPPPPLVDRTTPSKKNKKKGSRNHGKHTDRVVRHLSMRLANLSSLAYHDDDDDDDGDEDDEDEYEVKKIDRRIDQLLFTQNSEGSNKSPASSLESSPEQRLNKTNSSTSSAVIVDTPILVCQNLAAAARRRADTLEEANQQVTTMRRQQQQQQRQTAVQSSAGGHIEQTRATTTTTTTSGPDETGDSPVGSMPGGGGGGSSSNNNGDDSREQTSQSGQTELVEQQKQPPPPEQQDLIVDDSPIDAMGPDSGLGDEPSTECGCSQHEGAPISDEQFDIGVDILFSLIFTNSKFMRAHMVRRGMTNPSVSKWQRGESAAPETPGDRSNCSSTLSSRDGRVGATGQRQNSLDSLGALNARVGKIKPEQRRLLSYSMNVNHVLAKQVHVEERQNIKLAKPGLVYVLKSQTINSGFPCSEAFSIEMTYCLTRDGSSGRSRMLVHGLVNLIKEKHNWRVAMVKSVIEKSSMQGIQEFIADLTLGIRKYLASVSNGANHLPASQLLATCSDVEDNKDDEKDGTDKLHADRATTPTGGAPRPGKRRPTGSRSLARVKSKLKERKLRTMYKYYIQTAQVGSADGANENNDNDDDDGGGGGDGDENGVDGVNLEQHSSREARRRRRGHSRGNDSTTSARDREARLQADTDSCCSSSSSMIMSDGADNDSMVMMLTTTNDDENDDPSDDQRRHAVHHQTRRSRNSSQSARATHSVAQGKSERPAGFMGALGRRLTGRNLALLAVIGLLAVLLLAAFIVNAIVLHRLDRVELALQRVMVAMTTNCDERATVAGRETFVGAQLEAT